MCTGAEIGLIASTAASAGGSFLNSQQASKNAQAKINARNAAAAQEQERQKIFQANNDATINKTLTDFGKDSQQQQFGDLVAKREQAYTDNTPAAAEFANISDSTPTVVKTDLAKRVADKMAASKAEAKALAKIGGTTDVFQNNGFGINQAANKIGTENTLARGSLQTNLVEQQAAANNAGNKSSMFGDLLGAAGAIGGIAAGQAGGFGDLLKTAGSAGDGVLTAAGIRKTTAPLLPGIADSTLSYNDWGAVSPW